MIEPNFTLKSTAPRLARIALVRPRLQKLWEEIRDHAVVVVSAPGGFGKTTLLVQWRRLWLEKGVQVGWLSLDQLDDPPRLSQALLHTMRLASGRAAFETLSTQFARQAGRDLDALTSLLSTVASMATPTVLMLDDVERLPLATAERSLAYLLVNAPANLQIVIGSRAPLPIGTTEMLASGAMATLTAKELRLVVDESSAILSQRFDDRLSLDDRVKIHEITDGWPIGLQLAAATIEREPDLHAAVQDLSARRGAIGRYFLESLLSSLPPPLADFLIKIAALEDIEPDLCEQVTGCDRASTYIEQLIVETPILIVSESRDWTRMHPLARDFLRSQFERLPKSEQTELHRRAAEWFQAHGRYHEAGTHAMKAGDTAQAQANALRSLWDLGRMGKIAEARQWLDRIPQEALDRDVQLHLVAAWILALGDRAAEGLQIAERILNDRTVVDKRTRFLASTVAACAAVFCDRSGLLESMLERYPEVPAGIDDPVFRGAWTNFLSIRALHRGDNQAVRRIQANVQNVTDDWSMRIVVGDGRLLVGLSYLQDGNVYKAAATLQQPLVSVEQREGRRSSLAAMFGAVLAAAAYERGQFDTAEELLANRLDIIEHTSVPDVILHAYRTLARTAHARGDERRAIDVLQNLRGFAETHSMPRLLAASLAEETRIHALAERAQTALQFLKQLEAMGATFKRTEHSLLAPHFELTLAIAHTYCALAMHDGATAEDSAKRAEHLALRLNRGREQIVAKALWAIASDMLGSADPVPPLREAASLAALNGLDRVLAYAHPRAPELLNQRSIVAVRTPALKAAAPAVQRTALGQGGLLTPKEAQILGLLNAGMSNKQIARTLDIGGGTVKWHLKNLFAKLDAGSRQHAVDRARLLGLIGT